MSAAWKDMTDIERASALELMGGKRQANILSSLITNFQTVEDVIETSSSASGSAMAENEKYLASIQGHIDLFKNELQTLWTNMLDSDAIKFFVDLGTALLKLVDTMGAIPTAAGAFAAWKFAAKELQSAFNTTSTSTKTLKTKLIEWLDTQKATTAATNEATAATATNTAAQEENAIATQDAAAQNVVKEQSSNNSAQAEMNDAAASQLSRESDQMQGQMSLYSAECNDVEAQSAERARQAELGESESSQLSSESDQMQGQMSWSNLFNGNVPTVHVGGNGTPQSTPDSKNIGIFATMLGKLGKGAAKAGKAIKALSIGLGKGLLVMGAMKVATWAFGKAWDWLDKNIFNRAEHIKEEVTELQKTFEDAKKTFDENLKTLTTSSDTDTYATLTDEFRELTKGVDKYGNNISLTSDQYERYKAICEQIVGIQPSLVAGYDSATQAIGNNADALERLIELQKYEMRQKVDEFISDDNLEKMAENAQNSLSEAKRSEGAVNANKVGLFTGLSKAIRANKPELIDENGNASTDDEIAEYILGRLGYTKQGIQDAMEKYWIDIGDGNKYFDTAGFGLDYYDEIIERQSRFGEEYQKVISDTAADVAEATAAASKEMETAQNSLIDTFLQVPQGSAAGAYYDQLSNAGQKFLTDWIKNSNQFKVDVNDAEAIKNSRDNIISMTQYLVSDEFVNKQFQLSNGEQITGQDLLDKLYDLDPSKVNWGQYKAQQKELAETLWNTFDWNQFGITEEQFKVALGVEFVYDEDNEQAKEAKQAIASKLGVAEDEVQDWLDKQPAPRVLKTYEIDWAPVSGINTFEDLDEYLDQQLPVETFSSKTYSEISSSVETFNEILKQTSEVVSDNTEVTKEYKDSLTNLGFTQDELNDVFDENNPLLVKNAALLRKLILQKREEKKATVQMAQAQAKLQYRNTVKQIGQVVNAMKEEYDNTKRVSQATKNAIEVLRSQLTAIRQTIKEYSLLTLQLSDTTNAYKNFEKAKEIDAKLTYGDSAVEMLNTITEGFKTGKVGSEEFRAAVEAMVPESVYKHLTNFNDRMVAIHDYIDKNQLFADWFTFDEGEFKITQKNIQNFVDDMQNLELFTQSDENGNFFLKEGVTLDTIVEKTGVTKAAIIAMFTEFSKYDASWNDVLTDLLYPMDAAINKATIDLENATVAKAEYLKAGEGYNESGELIFDEKKWEELCAAETNATNALNAATDAAQKNAHASVQLGTLYDAVNGKITLSAEAAQNLATSLGLVDENGNAIEIKYDNGSIKVTQELIDSLLRKKEEIEEPAVVSVQADFDDLSKQLEAAKRYLEGNATADDKEILINAGIDFKDDEEAIKGKVNTLIDTIEPQIDEIQLKYGITKTTEEQQDDGTIEKLQDWETNGMKFTVNAETDEAEGKIDHLNAEKDQLSDSETTTYTVDGTGAAVVSGLVSSWANIVGEKKTTYTVEEKHTPTGRGAQPGVYAGLVGVDGTAHAAGDWGLKQNEHNALVGEIGRELIVDPHSGKYYTVGDAGAELVDLPKDAIVFNHKQTKEIFSNGHINSRGKMVGGQALAEGNAHYGLFTGYTDYEQVFANGSNDWVEAWDDTLRSISDAADSLSGAGNDLSDTADDFEEMFDWFEVFIEEIDQDLSYLAAALENAVGVDAKNNIQDQMININKLKLTELGKGYKLYADYAAELLAKVPEQYRDLAQQGGVALTRFLGEANQEVVEAINNYREWDKKAEDVKIQQQQINKEIASISLQKIQTISDEYDRQIALSTTKNDLLQANIDLLEEEGQRASAVLYEDQIKNSLRQLDLLQKKREEMQKEFDARVIAGDIEVGSEEWYDAVSAIQDVDKAIIECNTDIEGFQNSINQLHWDNFEKMIDAIDNIGEEISNLRDLIDEEDIADEFGNWTDKGITAMGLLAQEMERAKYRSQQYADEIKYLNQAYAAGEYSTDEYNEKLQELKDGQFDSIKSYEAAKDAIIELNKTRIESVKDGINKELEAYKKLIDTKKKELQLAKD